MAHTPTQIKRLVFAGGGIKGIAYLGALMAMRDMWAIEPYELPLTDIAGCSVGSLVSLLLCLRFTVAEMEAYLQSFDLSELVSVNVEAVLTTFAMNDGSMLKRLVHEALRLKGLSVDTTFAELVQRTGTTLHVVVTDLSKAATRMCSAETEPHMPVAKAVVASMSLPPLFSPVKYNGSLLSDGGLMANFPLEHFPPENTLGLRTAWYVDPSPPTDNLLTYYTRVLACLQLEGAAGAAGGPSGPDATAAGPAGPALITIDVGPLATLRFTSDKPIPEQISALVLQGYRQTIMYLARPDFKTVQDVKGPLHYLNA